MRQFWQNLWNDRRTDGQPDGRTDGQTLFYGTLPAEARVPIKNIHSNKRTQIPLLKIFN